MDVLVWIIIAVVGVVGALLALERWWARRADRRAAEEVTAPGRAHHPHRDL